MDIVTLAMAKAYTDSQRLAHAEYSEATLQYDGDSTDKFVLSGVDLGFTEDSTINYVRITDKISNATSCNKISVLSTSGYMNAYKSKDIKFVEEDGVVFVYTKELFENIPAFFVFPDVDGMGGAYVYEKKTGSNTTYIFSIEGNFTETIHPIDPKFLPGESVPNIIDATQFPCQLNGMDANFNYAVLYALQQSLTSGSVQKITVDDGGKLHDALKNNVNCKLRFSNQHSNGVDFVETAVSVVYNDASVASVSCGFILRLAGVGYVEASLCVSTIYGNGIPEGYSIVMRATPLGV